MKENISKVSQKIVEARLHELLRCARTSGVNEIKLLPCGIEIIVDRIVTTPLMRAAVSLQECYPEGGVYVATRLNTLVLCVYYKMEEENDRKSGNKNCRR